MDQDESDGTQSGSTRPLPLPDDATAIRHEGSDSDANGNGGGSRITPGAIVGERFRISGFVGRGGMGEIYRAVDLKLGQTVAIKFIAHERPAPDALRRFYDEVRLGRQVAHPSVCRVYELLEIEGRPFIVMEFVEGENLASLLTRVGRLPFRNAHKVAREVCAGIAAAHEQGISHGDLKPANIMIDGRGHARITDFGLARLAGDKGGGFSGGTLAYMAPEQLEGSETSERTDVYALGLVLYEIFTGRRVHQVSTIEESRAAFAESPPRPASLQPRIPAEIERTILRCLAKDPGERPESARDVLEILGGGDSLDAVILAGETPSPEYVAASRKVTQLKRRAAWTLFATAIALLFLVVWLSDRLTLYGRASFPLTPHALASRARHLAIRLGAAAPIGDEGSWFEANLQYLRPQYQSPGTSLPPGGIRLPPIVFHYRSSRTPMAPLGVQGVLRQDDPPFTQTGMVHVVLSPAGDLVQLQSLVPPEAGPPTPVTGPTLFDEAGLDVAKLTRIDSRWRPPVPCDFVAEWKLGTARVRTAVAGRHISAFEIVDPGLERSVPPPTVRLADTLYAAVLFAAVVAGVFLGRYNIRLRRVDRRGAAKLAVWVFCCRAAYELLASHHPLALQEEVPHLASIGGAALLLSAEVLVAYLALEPFVRRRWPSLMIGWMRFGQGRFGDAVVARDVLVGIVAGLVYRVIDHARNVAALMMPGTHETPSHLAVDVLASTRDAVAAVFLYHTSAIFYALFALFLLLLLKMLVRFETLTLLLWLAFTTTMFIRWGEPRTEIPIVVAQMAVLLFTMRRFGLLSLVAAVFTGLLTIQIPLTLDPSRFYFPSSALAVALVIALATAATAAALSKRSTAAPARTVRRAALDAETITLQR